jgi:hypothetical protein
MFKQGELVEIGTSSSSYEGVFINEDKDFLIVKLSNGYNIGIAKRNIKESKSLGKVKDARDAVAEKENEKGKKKEAYNPKLPARWTTAQAQSSPSSQSQSCWSFSLR